MSNLTRAGIRSMPLAVVLLVITACVVNPVTGQKELSLVSESQEIAIGTEQYLPSQQAQGGLYQVDKDLTAYVNEIGQRLARVSDRKLPYEFVVLNNSVPNAWCLPGGKIAVNRGLLPALENEAELAAVLGHEIVHAAARHGVNSMQRGLLFQGLVVATALSTSASKYNNYIVGGAQLGAQLVAQKFSRSDELEADHYGTIYMARAGYDPQASVTLQEKFVKLAEGKNPSWIDGLFASHPPSEERVRANQETVNALGHGGELDRERYQTKIAYLESKKPAYEAFDKAQSLAANKVMKKALTEVDRAIDLEPKEPRFYGLKGELFLAQNRNAAAAEEFNRALKMDASYFEYYLGRGLARARLGRTSEARTDLERSNQLLPTAAASNELGQLSLASGNRTLAKQYFESAMTASGAIGQQATSAFLRLDVPDNPDRYIKAQTILGADGSLSAVVINDTPYTVTDVDLEFRAIANGSVIRRRFTIASIAPRQQIRVASGWRFGAADVVENVRAVVTAARVK